MSDRREKQLEIVLQLNKLTKQGKMIWSWTGPLANLSKGKFYAMFKSRKYHLADSSSMTSFSNQMRNLDALPIEGSKYSLLIEGDDEEKEIWIPPTPAIDDLVRTVQHQLMKMEGDTQDLDEVLKDLEEAENLLQE